jgi:hypothetical protein
MDVGTIGGKSCQSGDRNLFDKTGLASDIKGDHRGIYPKVDHPKRDTILNRGFCFAFLLGLAVATQSQAEDYYIYQTPNGELVISNKEPPPGSKIIKQLPGVTDKEVPEAKAPGKTPPNVQTEGSPKPSKNK